MTQLANFSAENIQNEKYSNFVYVILWKFFSARKFRRIKLIFGNERIKNQGKFSRVGILRIRKQNLAESWLL